MPAQDNDSQFKPRVILPDPMQDVYQEAVKLLARQLRELYQLSDDDDEKLKGIGEFHGQ